MDQITSLHQKVDEYQQDPNLCADLNDEQCTILAELQIIYNILSNQTSTKVPSIYSTTCKGVIDAMEQFDTTYKNIESEQLYVIYIKKYKEAKEKYLLDRLLPIN
jgi:hypothetical protein